MPSFFEYTWFWNALSFVCGFVLTYWLLKKPLPFLGLLALIGALFLLFGPFALPGFAAAAAFRALWPKNDQNDNTKKTKSKRASR